MQGFEAVLSELVPVLLPSVTLVRPRRVNGFILLQFDELDDFVVTSIGASSANIKTSLINTFVGKDHRPRSIRSCILRLELTAGLLDPRILYFLMELVLVRQKENSLSDESCEAINRKLRALEDEYCRASPEAS
jgi:hypothetical protein